MPMYDYRTPSGKIFEFFNSYENRLVAVCPESGEIGTLVWVSSPSVSVPQWHKSAPTLPPSTVTQLKEAADPKNPIQVREPGYSREVARNKREREKTKEQAIEKAVTQTLEKAGV